jgi:hypothetical protein
MTNAVAADRSPPWARSHQHHRVVCDRPFAYLTTPIGRIPASFEMRAFVSSGFAAATFSAFSLQTLELARSAIGSVAGNIVLSVAARRAA